MSTESERVLRVIKERRSIRKFLPRPIAQETIEEIVDCARFAPSAINIQPWHFIVVTDEAVRRKIADVCDYGKFVAQSPCCILVFCEDTKYYLEDGCAATENILLAAHALGIGSCWIAGDKKPYGPAIGKLLKVPPKCRLVSLVALGYPAETPRPSKKGLDEVLHWESW